MQRPRKQIARRVLAELQHKDAEGKSDVSNLFGQPVVEAYPAITAAYLGAVKHPMDFQTLGGLVDDGKVASEQEFSDLVDVIWLNCWAYNVPERKGQPPTIFQVKALEMQRFSAGVLAASNLPAPSPRQWSDILHDKSPAYRALSGVCDPPVAGSVSRKRSASTTPPGGQKSRKARKAAPAAAADGGAKPALSRKKPAASGGGGGGDGGSHDAGRPLSEAARAILTADEAELQRMVPEVALGEQLARIGLLVDCDTALVDSAAGPQKKALQSEMAEVFTLLKSFKSQANALPTS
ncbi:hypothetical protein DIPPA_05960 [Diplonema papillatum]|nr:hypothetical protein DIPPA_05960 [Diplonema papillatum]